MLLHFPPRTWFNCPIYNIYSHRLGTTRLVRIRLQPWWIFHCYVKVIDCQRGTNNYSILIKSCRPTLEHKQILHRTSDALSYCPKNSLFIHSRKKSSILFPFPRIHLVLRTSTLLFQVNVGDKVPRKRFSVDSLAGFIQQTKVPIFLPFPQISHQNVVLTYCKNISSVLILQEISHQWSSSHQCGE